MRISHVASFKTTIIADKGKVFDLEKIKTANLIDPHEAKTLKLYNEGEVIRYYSSIDPRDIPDNKFIEWFAPYQVDDP